MHELSIAQSLVTTVLKEMEQRKLSSVKKIGLRVGAWSGVLADALLFSYESIVTGTQLADTKLEIEEVPMKAFCKACGREFQIKELTFTCPDCASSDLKIDGSDELNITYLEVD